MEGLVMLLSFSLRTQLIYKITFCESEIYHARKFKFLIWEYTDGSVCELQDCENKVSKNKILSGLAFVKTLFNIYILLRVTLV